MIWREKKGLGFGLYRWTTSEVSWVSMRMDKVPNARVRQLCGVTNGVDEKIDEDVLRWFGHLERMENDRIAKSVYVVECVSSRSVGRLRESWIDVLKDGLKRKGLGVRQARIMVHDSVWRGFVRAMHGALPGG